MDAKILIVDDEREIADLLEVYLVNEGFGVVKCETAKDALACIDNEVPSLAILDVMLPDADGFSLCQSIRSKYLFPIIMLTAKIEDADKIYGLTLGADDYITKPFNPLEVLTRVKSQLRRYTRYNGVGKSAAQDNSYDIRGLHISSHNRKCTLNGKTLALTPIEFNILWLLCERKGSVVSSEDLFESVWKEKYLDNNNTVMAHIARLREKMSESPRNPKYIKTVWGIGYTIE